MNIVKSILIGLLLIGIVSISGCADQEEGVDVEAIKQFCIQACKDALGEGRDLSDGPCLLNPMTENTDWVCDVAHDPRQPADNVPENQCPAFREGRAHHFVEVDPDCNFIKSY